MSYFHYYSGIFDGTIKTDNDSPACLGLLGKHSEYHIDLKCNWIHDYDQTLNYYMCLKTKSWLRVWSPQIRKYILDDKTKEILNTSAKKLNLSARAYHRVIKLARTIADLEGDKDIKTSHILEALQYRPKNSQF